MSQPARIFISYSHQDEGYLKELATHLAPLRRQGLIQQWADRDISAGADWEHEIARNLEEADLVLLLISASFMASDYCFGVELKRALERHAAGQARVIPIIVRPGDWKAMPFAKLQALPRDARPVSTWRDRDEAWLDVVSGIKQVVAKWQPTPDAQAAASGASSSAARGNSASAADEIALQSMLAQLLPAQFSEVVFRLQSLVNAAHLSPSSVPQAERAIELLRAVRAIDGGMAALAGAIRQVTGREPPVSGASMRDGPPPAGGATPGGSKTPTSASLRKLLNEVLRTDGDLDAFCMDFFADVHRRFSAAMDRVAKVNLLLQLGDRGKILRHLEEEHGEAVERNRELLRYD